MNEIIFVLEDMKARMPIFRRIAKNAQLELIHCETAQNAKQIFLKVDPKIVFLDHDLGGRIFVNSNDEETGYTFAKWMVENDFNYRERNIIIHSANPGGAENIKSALNGHASIVPISHFVRRDNVLYKYGLTPKS